MTTTVITTQTGPLTANGTTPLPFTFQAISADEIEVTREGAVASPATYLVDLNEDGTGEIIPSGSWGSDEVYIYSVPSYQMPTEFERHGAFYPDQINSPLDRLARTIIALKDWLVQYTTAAIDAAIDAIVVSPSGSSFVTPQDYGAVGDGVTDDSAAFVAAIAYLKSIASNNVANTYKGSPKLFVPAGHYLLGTTTLDITHTLIIEGEGSGLQGGQASKLRWLAGASGFRIQAHNTVGATGADATHFSGAGSIIRGLQITGGYAGTEGEYHGVHMRARAVVEDCYITDFQGDGIYAKCVAGGGDPVEGNANGFGISRVALLRNRNGAYVDSADVNAGYGEHIDASANRQWGIWDSSFLGNTWDACHTSTNGWIAGSTPCTVTHGGNRYCVALGQEAGASTNAPSGTTADNTWWLYIGAGGANAPFNINAWVNGTTYRTGGAYRSDGVNAETVFHGCYSESDQALSQGVSPSLSIGGGQGAPWRGSHVHLSNYLGAFSSIKHIMSRNLAATFKTSIQNGEDNEAHLRLTHSTKAPLDYTLAWVNNNLVFNYQGSGSNTLIAYEVTGPSSPRNVGTHKINFPVLFGIADKKMLNGTAAPVAGTYVQGDICWNTAPAAGGIPGWVCTTGGTPGTWKAMGVLAA